MNQTTGAHRRVVDLTLLTGQSLWLGFLEFYNSDNLTYAASIAYYALLSLFPFSMLALGALGRAAGDAADRTAVLDFVLTYFPKQFEFITTQLDAFQSESVTLGVVGTVTLVWGALGVFGAVTTAVNYAWRVEQNRSYWHQKLFSFVMMLVAAALLLVALLLVSASSVVGASWFADVLYRFPGLAILRGLALRWLPTLLFILVVGLIFYFVPNTKVRFRDVWIGAFITGFLWKGALQLFSMYMADMTRFTRVNGSIAAVVVFLGWVYLQAVILLYGVEFTATFARLRKAQKEKARSDAAASATAASQLAVHN